ncbi:hypothetical protein RchiOBHm_Chr4g0399661 [Rosa chinensis]|uniref:Uncharacterized protein n=1 Tax=Rosa chinensis TaxID=74649 RepID=A0A2P6QSN3_ROSCH|nr:hypothetical protein RchiOBHm_Chr4g0399661 [Rosa chinensis]
MNCICGWALFSRRRYKTCGSKLCISLLKHRPLTLCICFDRVSEQFLYLPAGSTFCQVTPEKRTETPCIIFAFSIIFSIKIDK